MSIIVKIARELIDVISPELRDYLKDAVSNISAHAAKTPNPWDDLLASLLKAILNL